MCWPRETRVRAILLILLAVVIDLALMGGVMPFLWPYRDHPLVRVLFAFLSGGHLEELLPETRALL